MGIGRVLLHFGAAVLLTDSSVLADQKCDAYDDKIGAKIFDPIKKQIAQSVAQPIYIESFTSSKFASAYIVVKNGTIDDIAAFELAHISSDAASLCIDSGPSKTVSTLEATIKYRIRADFDGMGLFIPGMPPIGATNTSLVYEADYISINVSVTREGDKCKATINSVVASGLGDLRLVFRSNHSLMASIAADIFRVLWIALWILSTPFISGDTATNFLMGLGERTLVGNQDIACELVPRSW